MPRFARASAGGYCYHVINRGNARAEVFHKEEDLAAFVRIMGESCIRVPMRVVAYCLMPNHFHLVVWPSADGELSRWMHWLLTTHVRRYLRHYGHSGHVWQGRFKAFPIQQDEHLLTVVRYVERNPLRAGLVERAQDWRWWHRPKPPLYRLDTLCGRAPKFRRFCWRKNVGKGESHGPKSVKASPPCISLLWDDARWSSRLHDANGSALDPGPVSRGPNWLEFVNTPMTEAEVAAIRLSLRRDRPYGTDSWTTETAGLLGLEYSLRSRGRQPRHSPGK